MEDKGKNKQRTNINTKDDVIVDGDVVGGRKKSSDQDKSGTRQGSGGGVAITG